MKYASSLNFYLTGNYALVNLDTYSCFAEVSLYFGKTKHINLGGERSRLWLLGQGKRAEEAGMIS